ncbi:MAG: DUF4234 domain-containing protein [Chloroflexota bacterium]|nr:DUF4234 domain-containing protein [Chloroflexota bacterium]
MVHSRSIPLSVILTFLTCGLYGLYWFVCMANDIKTLRGGSEPSGIRDLLLGIITFGIFFWYCMYQYPRYVSEIQDKKGLPASDISIITLILAIFGLSIISYALIQNELNKIAEPAS